MEKDLHFLERIEEIGLHLVHDHIKSVMYVMALRLSIHSQYLHLWLFHHRNFTVDHIKGTASCRTNIIYCCSWGNLDQR